MLHNLLKILATMASLALLTACSTPRAMMGTNPVAGLPYRHHAFDLKVAWKTVKVSDGLVVEGLIKNVRFFQARDFDITIYLLDKDDRVLATNGSLTLPSPLAVNDYVDFNVKLKRTGLGEGNRLKFVIRCLANDSSKESFIWMSSFVVDATTGTPVTGEKTPVTEW